jgi:DNA-directed RNA polymerase specialized sigma24 family protein
MQMKLQTLHNQYKERLNDIEHIINMESNGNDDLKQEGLLGAYQALQIDPYAKNRFLINKAKWEMVCSLRKGRSVDNGFYKRKNLKIIHYTQSPCEDGIFAAVVSSNGKEPVDEKAIFRVDLERFMKKLTPIERRFIRYKVMDGLSDVCIKRKVGISFKTLSDVCIKRKVGISFKTLKDMKENIRRQIELSFAR